jgi:uncharacterized protein
VSGLPAPDPAAACLITGASSGIGAALARELAARGYGVVLLARREARLRSLAKELAATHGVRAEALPCDLTNPIERDMLTDRIEAFGLRVDVLVSNAGLGTHGSFVEVNPSREIEQVRVMCEASVGLCATFAPTMAERGAGGILIVASLAAFQPLPNTATYGACKAFLLSLGEALHAELRDSGVAISTLCPGPVRTEFFDPTDEHPSERLFPAPAWKTAEEVALAGVEGLARNRRVILPGAVARILTASGRYCPHALQLPLLNRLYGARHTAAQG